MMRVPALRGRTSCRFGCERVGCEPNFVAARLRETENRTQHIGNLGNVGPPSASLLSKSLVRFPSPFPTPAAICSVPRCKARAITLHTSGRKL
jgi:hypothetical protein